MTTTEHPIVEQAERILREAADLVALKWQRCTTLARGYGIPEALTEAARGDRAALVIAERQCNHAGLDVWWNDLVCSDGYTASGELEAVAAIDPEQLYGHMWEANLGLIMLASTVTPEQINGLANMMSSAQSDAFIDCMELARSVDRQRVLLNLCNDVHFATGYYATTPAGVARRLKGIRALECVAAHHVLQDKLSTETARTLVEPVAAILLRNVGAR
jgi:hypothetical protein